MDIIPSLDILDRQLVRVFKCATHNPADLTYHPVDMAKQFARLGFSRLQLVDLSDDQEFIERIVSEIGHLPIALQVQGNIGSVERAKSLVASGVDRVVVDFELLRQDGALYLAFMNAIGLGKLAVSVELREGLASGGMTMQQVLENLNMLKHLVITCKDKVDPELVTKICVANPDIHVTASGGVASLTLLGKLQKGGVKQVVIGRALYEDETFREDVVASYNNQLLLS